MRRLRGALGMGLTWGAVGFVVGMVIELVHNVWPNPLGAAVDIWPAALAWPGLVGGVLFSAVLGVAARRLRFDELSLPRVAAWGGLGGLLVALVPVALVAAGLGTANVPLWQIAAGLAVACVPGGALAAAGTLALARRAVDRELLEAGQEVAGVGLSPEESRRLLG